MKDIVSTSRWLFLLLVIVGALASGGCATADSENVSERPWNTPQGWENGLPSSMFNQYK